MECEGALWGQQQVFYARCGGSLPTHQIHFGSNDRGWQVNGCDDDDDDDADDDDHDDDDDDDDAR